MFRLVLSVLLAGVIGAGPLLGTEVAAAGTTDMSRCDSMEACSDDRPGTGQRPNGDSPLESIDEDHPDERDPLLNARIESRNGCGLLLARPDHGLKPSGGFAPRLLRPPRS